MDPYQTYLAMFEAMQTNDHETARELAFALHDWIAKGGFCPDQVTLAAMQVAIHSVLRRTDRQLAEPAFSLTCRECDAGEDVETEEQAIALGWTEIEPAFDLPQANYCGLCPDCRETISD